ncbi:MAG: hypothetical protein JWR07_1310 [Nevskia sp.]|nr:hypothetical protein [Nevskia sp.]
MIIIESVGAALALFSIVEGYASLFNSATRIHIADWRKGAGPDGVNIQSSIFHFGE